MTQSVEGSALEGQGCTTADHDPNLLGYFILDGALDSLFEGIQWDVEQRYVTTSQTTQKKSGPAGTGPDLE
jgi:hypothetical protein